MELLYVWIDEYKNIKQQGFCFSAEYEIEFRKIYKHTEKFRIISSEGNLYIAHKPKKIVENLWSERVTNLTAIVGENGTGKSNLLEEIGYSLILKSLLDASKNYILAFKDKSSENDNSVIKLYHNIEKINISKPKSDLLPALPEIEQNNPNKPESETNDYPLLQTKTIFYTQVFDQRNSDKPKAHYDISTNRLIYEDSQKRSKPNCVQSHRYANIRKQLDLASSKLADTSGLNIPKKVTIELIYTRVEEEKVKNQNWIIYQDLSSFFQKNEKGREKIISILLNNLYQNLSVNFEKPQINDSSTPLSVFQAFLKQKGIPKGACEFFNKLFCVKANASFNISTADYLLEIDLQDAKGILISYEEYMINLPQKNKVDFINFTWRDLSSGEKTILDFYARFYYVREKIKQLDDQPQLLYILIDEGEVGLHPQWQKEYIDKLITFLPICFPEQKLQIILTTHSPLILSDIPKNNVVFLKKWQEERDREKHPEAIIEEGNCFVVPQKHTPQTFGANIHTLLANSFFLDSTMGSFAEEKIRDLVSEIKVINQKTSDLNEEKKKEYLDQIKQQIDIIGEPILKSKIEAYYRDQTNMQVTLSAEEYRQFLQYQESKKTSNSND